MRSLVLTEYVPSDPVSLSLEERDALRSMVPGLTVQPVIGEVEAYQLTSGSTVGVLRVGDLTVELRPKVGLAAVLFLVSYALDPEAWRPKGASLVEDATLAELFVPLFARMTQRALRPGLLHGYRREEEALTTVRGRVPSPISSVRRPGCPSRSR